MLVYLRMTVLAAMKEWSIQLEQSWNFTAKTGNHYHSMTKKPLKII